MPGFLVALFMLYLAAALLDRRRARDAERHVIMVGFTYLVPVVLAQHLPPLVLPPRSLFFAAHLGKTR